jgi:hypothetical protein
MSSEGQQAAQKNPRQARSESSSGPAARGGDDCRIAGFRFCSS